MENDSVDDINRRIDDLSDEDDEEEFSNVPIDRGWAWVTVVGAFGIFFLIVGVLKSFGVLLLELSRRYDAPASLLAASQSLCGYLHLGLGPFSNALSLRFNHRKIVFIGGLIAGIGLIVTAYIQSIGFFFVTYGLLAGFGFGLCLSPSLVFPGQYFKKKLAIANGLASSGSGAGSFVFPNLMRYLLDHYMIDGCLLLLGGLVLNACACACLYRPISFWSKSRKKDIYDPETRPLKPGDRHGNDVSVENLKTFSDVSEQNHFLSCENIKQNGFHPYDTSVSLSVPCLHSRHHTRERHNTLLSDYGVHESRRQGEKMFDDSALLYASLESIPISLGKYRGPKSVDDANNIDTDIKDKIKPKNRIIDCQICKNPIFQIINMAIFCGIYAHHSIYNFVPPLANEKGFSDSEGALFVSIVGITDLIGRISSGILSDTLCLRRISVFQINSLIFGSCIVLLIHMDTFVGFIITCVLMGLSTGGYIGIQIAVLAEIMGRENLSTSWGYVAFFASISILISPIITGVLKDYTNSWIPGFWLAAVAAVVGSIALCLISLIELRDKRKDKS